MSNLSVGAEEAIARRRPSKVSLRHRSSGRRQGGGTGSSATGRVTGGGPNSSSRGAHANAGGTATGELQLEHSPDSDSKLLVNKPLVSALQQAAERVVNLSAAMRVAYAPFNRQLYALLGRCGSTKFVLWVLAHHRFASLAASAACATTVHVTAESWCKLFILDVVCRDFGWERHGPEVSES